MVVSCLCVRERVCMYKVKVSVAAPKKEEDVMRCIVANL